MTPEQIAEGRRLKAAANEALEMGERVSVREGLKAVDAWDRWLDVNSAALFDAAESAEAAERKLAEARAKIDALMLEYCPDEMTPGQVDEWARHQRPIDAERGK